MPKTDKFGLEILVGGKPIPEYKKDDKCYVESDLNDANHSTVKMLQMPGVDGEQAWPVTPFAVRVSVDLLKGIPSDTVYQVKLFVDGYQSFQRKLKQGDDFVSEGFAEVHDNELNIRQYCFSLPQNAEHEGGKSAKNISYSRASKIGTVRAEFYTTTYVGEPRFMVRPRHAKDQYVQATKSDVMAITGGAFTACTTMKGDVTKSIRLPNDRGAGNQRRRAPWFMCYRATNLLDTLEVRYRMGHDLVAMGLKKDTSPAKKEKVTKVEENGDEGDALKDVTDLKPDVKDVKTADVKLEQMTQHFENMDTKCNIKKEPERGIITLDEEEYDSDCLELMDSYILISDGEDDDVYIVEDLIDPSILELDDSELEGCLEGDGDGLNKSTHSRNSVHLGRFGIPD